MADPTVKASDFPVVYDMLGIDTGRLGCIMIDTEPLKVSDIIPADALYQKEGGEDYLKGYVSEEVAHVTLLYGLMRSGQELKNHVDNVLLGWKPQTILIDKVGFFYGKDDQSEFITLIALLQPNDSLIEGNARIRFLPHIDTFPEYHPHITLAYVKTTSDWTGYIKQLDDRFSGQSVVSVGLNYGK